MINFPQFTNEFWSLVIEFCDLFYRVILELDSITG